MVLCNISFALWCIVLKYGDTIDGDDEGKRVCMNELGAVKNGCHKAWTEGPKPKRVRD